VSNPSGMAYVSMTLKEDHVGEERDTAMTKVMARVPKRCKHVATVCEDCVGDWERDWVVHFERTSRGRLIQDRRKQK